MESKMVLVNFFSSSLLPGDFGKQDGVRVAD